ncbi:MAG: tRNA pseudouridine(55) synthase TruB [Betaproteobacteria bacterium]|nr:MAG: tRNA pseudouridine(55) synthase TruB [Betaproteobacteria bacterium]
MTPQLHGVALVDKPAGMSSFSVVSRIRRVFRPLGVSKAGHTGTLDPLATGLLPICLGEATKFAQRLLDADKGYLATVKLGAATASGDAEGEIIARSDVRPSGTDIQNVLAQFRGVISQVPPAFSALKINGKAAYEYARAGQTIEMKPRTVEILDLKLLVVRGDAFDIAVRCTKGTYIRSLAVDIAIALGTVGHLSSLRRTLTGGFALDAAKPLDQWMEASDAERASWLLPTDSLVADFPRLDLSVTQGIDVRNGKVVALHGGSLPSALSDDGLLRLYDEERGFFGLGTLNASAELRVSRLLSTAQ